jgi:hypothetical protein
MEEGDREMEVEMVEMEMIEFFNNIRFLSPPIPRQSANRARVSRICRCANMSLSVSLFLMLE